MTQHTLIHHASSMSTTASTTTTCIFLHGAKCFNCACIKYHYLLLEHFCACVLKPSCVLILEYFCACIFVSHLLYLKMLLPGVLLRLLFHQHLLCNCLLLLVLMDSFTNVRGVTCHQHAEDLLWMLPRPCMCANTMPSMHL
jgi:hypothetical protein